MSGRWLLSRQGAQGGAGRYNRGENFLQASQTRQANESKKLSTHGNFLDVFGNGIGRETDSKHDRCSRSGSIDGSSKSLEQVKNGIIAGCKFKRWAPVEEEPGKISCSISVRAKHYAEVEITHTESSYSINYKDSRDLDYNEKKQKIHRNYNKWVILLSEAIQTELAKSQG
jgi:hypothetical protein